MCTTPIEERTPNGFVRLEDGRFGLGFWLTIEEERRSTGTILGMDADKFEEKRERAIELMKLHDVALWGLRSLSAAEQEATNHGNLPTTLQFPRSAFPFPELLRQTEGVVEWLRPMDVANYARLQVEKRQKQLDRLNIPRVISPEELDALMIPIQVRDHIDEIQVEAFTDFWRKHVAPDLMRGLDLISIEL